MVIDIYIWLCYRLHAIRKEMEIGWPALHGQFGAGYGRLRDFRADFIAGLELAVAVYPDARISIGDRGVILRPSRPAVARLA